MLNGLEEAVLKELCNLVCQLPQLQRENSFIGKLTNTNQRYETATAISCAHVCIYQSQNNQGLLDETTLLSAVYSVPVRVTAD